MEKGLAIIERDETETKAFFIDHEALEFTRQNAKTKKRLADIEEENKIKEKQHRKESRVQARRRAYLAKTVGYICTRCVLSVAVAWAGMAGMIHPAICVPVSVFFICAACLRLGKLFGFIGNK